MFVRSFARPSFDVPLFDDLSLDALSFDDLSFDENAVITRGPFGRIGLHRSRWRAQYGNSPASRHQQQRRGAMTVAMQHQLSTVLCQQFNHGATIPQLFARRMAVRVRRVMNEQNPNLVMRRAQCFAQAFQLSVAEMAGRKQRFARITGTQRNEVHIAAHFNAWPVRFGGQEVLPVGVHRCNGILRVEVVIAWRERDPNMRVKVRQPVTRFGVFVRQADVGEIASEGDVIRRVSKRVRGHGIQSASLMHVAPFVPPRQIPQHAFPAQLSPCDVVQRGQMRIGEMRESQQRLDALFLRLFLHRSASQIGRVRCWPWQQDNGGE